MQTENMPNGKMSIRKNWRNLFNEDDIICKTATKHFFFRIYRSHDASWCSIHHKTRHMSSRSFWSFCSTVLWIHQLPSPKCPSNTATPTYSTWCLPLQRSSHETPTLPSISNSGSECSCYHGNKSAKSLGPTWEEKTRVLSQNITQWKCSHFTIT